MLAYLAACRKERSEAVRAAAKCLALYKLVVEPNPHHFATYVMMLSYVLAENRQFPEAIAYGEEGLKLFARLLGQDDTFVRDREKDVESMRRTEVREYLDKGNSVGSS